MKKLVCLLLAAVFLAGCAGNGAVAPEAAPVEPTGIYDPDHTIEQQTNGAMLAYPLLENNYAVLTMIGNRPAVITDDGNVKVMQGPLCELVATCATKMQMKDSTAYDTSTNGFAYYDAESNSVILLNPQLQETNRFAMPEQMQGTPVICLESGQIFYCVPGEIRALELDTGIARLIKSHTVENQRLTGCYFDGKMIRCLVTDSSGKESVLYLSAETGITLSQDRYMEALTTWKDTFFVQRTDNTVAQKIFGTMEGPWQALQLQEGSYDRIVGVLPMDGALSYRMAEGELLLQFHDLSEGKTVAQAKLTGVSAPIAVAADENYIWMILPEGDRQVLCRWDVTKSVTDTENASIAPLYTAENPDLEGLKACQEKVDKFNKSYGVRISIWDQVEKYTGSYAVTAEHQPVILMDMLTQLEPILARFPSGFMSSTVRNGNVRICLVRSIESGEDCVRFWNNGDFCILIGTNADPDMAFLQAVSYAVDTHVLGNSRDFDTWDQLNPQGFRYINDKTENAKREDAQTYLEGEKRAFVDLPSMLSPSEDRSRMLLCAVVEGNEQMFQSDIMQAKLRRLCEGIREAYGLEKKKEVYLWEQYLKEPMVQVDG